MHVYTIRDAKSEVFGPPFCKRAHGDAERDFTRLSRSKESQISEFPEDYDLWYLGTYDDGTGKFGLLETPQHMLKAVQVKNQAPLAEA